METMEHLTAGQLAGYLDAELDATQRLVVESHLDACVECRGELIDLARILGPKSARAGSLGRIRASARWWVPAAVAAGLVGLALFAPQGSTGPLPEGLERPGADFFESARITTVAPFDGATTSVSNLVFTWRALATETYRLTLLTDTGELIWTLDTPDTVAILPRAIVLSPGASYFWRVEAIADGISATSDVQRLEIAR
jgi:hypothetical protein